jgi:isoleucyl-tRNA synthetase
MSDSFENEELKCFQELVKKGYISSRFKPVHWCWNCETSLAESELEYKDIRIFQKILCMYVLFPTNDNLFLLVWTTIPWTLSDCFQ